MNPRISTLVPQVLFAAHLMALLEVGHGFMPHFTTVDHTAKITTSLSMVSTIQKVAVGDHTIQLRHQLFLGDVQSQNGADLTGLKYWPTASEPLLDRIHKKKPPFDNKQSISTKQQKIILELGSGCGLLGIGLASLDPKCRVILTDAPVDFVDTVANGGDGGSIHVTNKSSACTTLDWLQENVNLNNDELLHDRVSVSPLYWGDTLQLDTISKNSNGCVDWIVGSELLYNNDDSFEGLVKTLVYFSDQNPDIKILLAYKQRNLGEAQFFDLAAPYFDFDKTRIGRKSDGIYLVEFHRRS